MQPVQSTQASEHRAVVKVGTSARNPIDVILIKENRSWVIDEIILREPNGQVVELRKSLRQEIAQQFLTDPSGGIQQASFQSIEEDSTNVDSVKKSRGNLTMPSSAARKPIPRGIDMTEELPKKSPAKATRSTETSPSTVGDQMLQFGPSAAKTGGGKSGVTQANLEISTNDVPAGGIAPPPKIRPRSAAETVVDGGVVYFRGAPNQPLPAKDSAKVTETETANGIDSEPTEIPFGDRSTITDPSGSPIEIPME